MSEYKAETITVRVSPVLKSGINMRAEAARMTPSDYLRHVLAGQAVESLPMLAALGHIIAIYATVASDPTQAAATLDEVSALVQRMSILAHAEVAL